MIPIIASLLGTLAESGLGLLSSAIQAKGKEVVENAIGVKISDNPNSVDVAKLRQVEFDQEERLLELGIEKARLEQEELKALLAAQASQDNNVTDRWKADMSSDSWLSKNIRPLALIAIFVAFFLFTMMSAFGFNAQESYVNLLGQWGQIIFLAYFGGRTVEKLADMRSKK